MSVTVLHRHTAYRRGLCVLCQRVSQAAGMTRCIFCHSEVTSYRLTARERQRYLTFKMVGLHPTPAAYALAVVIIKILTAPTPAAVANA